LIDTPTSSRSCRLRRSSSTSPSASAFRARGTGSPSPPSARPWRCRSGSSTRSSPPTTRTSGTTPWSLAERGGPGPLQHRHPRRQPHRGHAGGGHRRVVPGAPVLRRVHARGRPGTNRFFAIPCRSSPSRCWGWSSPRASSSSTSSGSWWGSPLPADRLWFERSPRRTRARRPFIVNRVGDFGFLIGILIIYATCGVLAVRRGSSGRSGTGSSPGSC